MDETRSEIARLSELGHIEYARERQSAAKRLGVNLGALDAAVDEARAKQRKNDGETTTAFLSDPVPWPEPVEGEQLITEILQHYKAPHGAFRACVDRHRVACCLHALPRCGSTLANPNC